MPADEYADWQAYFQVEPQGLHGIEILIAQLCQAVIAASGTRPPDMEELMPFVTHRKRILGPKRLTGEALYNKAMAGATMRIVNNGG